MCETQAEECVCVSVCLCARVKLLKGALQHGKVNFCSPLHAVSMATCVTVNSKTKLSSLAEPKGVNHCLKTHGNTWGARGRDRWDGLKSAGGAARRRRTQDVTP